MTEPQQHGGNTNVNYANTNPDSFDHPLAAGVSAGNTAVTPSSMTANTPGLPPHPLRSPPPPPPPPPPLPAPVPQQQQQQQHFPTAPPPPPPPGQYPYDPLSVPAPVSAPPPTGPQTTTTIATSTTTSTTTSSSTTTTATSRPVPPQRTRSGKSTSSSKPLDGMADEFLSSSPSYRLDVLGLEPILRPLPLPKEDGIHRLRTLVVRRAWGDVLKMSTTLLNSTASQHAAVYGSLVTLPLNAQAAATAQASSASSQIRMETVEIMMLQCHAWLKLRRYNDLAAEIERWNFLIQNDAAATSPPWLPWGIHILAAQTQEYTKTLQQSSTDILYNLRQKIADSPNNQDDGGNVTDLDGSTSAIFYVPMWLVSVDNALANIYVRRQEWRQALGSWDRALKLLPEATRAEIKSNANGRYDDLSTMTANDTLSVDHVAVILQNVYRCEILSRQGRVLLQAGAIFEASEIFDLTKAIFSDDIEPRISTLPTKTKEHPALKSLPSLIEINEALCCFSKSRYGRALQCFTNAVDYLRKDDTINPTYIIEDWVGPSIGTCIEPNVLYSEAVGNMALCHLYECRMKEAVGLLEGLVREDPTAFLTERVAFNLCTLYELGSETKVGTRKKKVLQLIAKRFFLHDVGPESFRIN